MKIPGRKQLKYGAVMALLLGVAGALMLECKSKNVPFINDKDQIISYMSTSSDALALFRGDGIFPRGAFRIPGTTAVKRDSILSHTRAIDAVVGSQVDYGYLGFLAEALATVTDKFSVREFRTDTSGTTSLDFTTQLVRYGFFLKLGSDYEPYVGWTLYGYAQGQVPSGVTVTPLGSASFAGDGRLYNQSSKGGVVSPAFVKLGDLGSVAAGSQVEIRAGASFPPLLSILQDSGYFNQCMQTIDAFTCIDTVGTRSASGQLFGFAALRYLVRGSDTVSTALSPNIVPFRVR